ncbi:MAG: hypothetical protein N2257_02340 [Thermodesulfovibrionales bacterium]|nr:hypothetical protein [Thermodesulfovibrionales bacterium]
MKKLGLILFFIISLIMWILFLENQSTFKNEPLTLQELRDVKIDTEGPSGKLWRLEAERAVLESDDSAILYDIKFFSDKRGIELKAPYGRYELNKGLAEINGGVLIKLTDGSEARITSLRIEKGVIKSEEPVIIRKGNIILRGRGIISDSDSNIRILRDVRLEIK